MVNNILIVGSSIAMVFIASGFSISATVSPISNPSKPTRAQISPACTSSTFLRPSPSKVCNSLIFVFFTLPSLFTKATCIPAFKVPLCKRPIAIRPVKEEKSNEVINICRLPCFTSKDGTCSNTISSNGSIESVSSFQCSLIQLFFAEPYTVGKSNCHSSAPNSNIKSNTFSCTSSGVQFSLSTLLITTQGFKPRSKAFCNTKRVCGIGPSKASTSKQTPSAIFNTRSTSPPKSA